MAKILVMGVSGSGKSTVGKGLAVKLGIPFLEGDDFHPPHNVEKMKSGSPLTDEDRVPWLEQLYKKVCEVDNCVLSCSALKASYRDILCQENGIDHIVYLQGSYDLIWSRMQSRKDHFMPPALLQSQFDTLEETEDYISIDQPIANIIKTAIRNITVNNNKYDIGLLGLGVMGKSLARNLASRGLKVAVYNIPFPGEEKAVADFVSDFPEASFGGADSLEQFVESLAGPRVVFLMIKAGEAIDEMIAKLKPLLSKDDMIIDGGNSFFKDTRRRAIALEKENLHFVGVGVSGGEEGALKGPAIMPAGTSTAKERILPMLQKIAAVADGQPCVNWLGTDGSGHFVKMLHNGIEYADMQLLTEAYALCKNVAEMDNEAIANLFESWKDTPHNSYLLDITIDILRKKDVDGSSLLENILDVAGHKGTGLWTSREALEIGVASPTITAAMHQRIISSYKSIRSASAELRTSKNEKILNVIQQGFLAARMIALMEGFHIMKVASDHYGWNLQFDKISQLWRGGCIIRSDMLPVFKAAFERNNNIAHLISDKSFESTLDEQASYLLILASEVMTSGVATPCLSAAANYYKSLKTAYLPINLIQAQRDYFGAHTYKRKDSPDKSHHTDWLS